MGNRGTRDVPELSPKVEPVTTAVPVSVPASSNWSPLSIPPPSVLATSCEKVDAVTLNTPVLVAMALAMAMADRVVVEHRFRNRQRARSSAVAVVDGTARHRSHHHC
jgi:hypothetical protein